MMNQLGVIHINILQLIFPNRTKVEQQSLFVVQKIIVVVFHFCVRMLNFVFILRKKTISFGYYKHNQYFYGGFLHKCGFLKTLWVKNAFAIISRLAKSVGNSFGIKSTTIICDKRLVWYRVLFHVYKRCTRNMRDAIL